MSFSIAKGTNISHWLSQSDVRGEQRRAFFSRDNVRELRNLGFDHIRIPIDEEQIWDMDGKLEDEAMGLLHNGLDWCEAEGLKAIVDLHILRSHCFIDNQGKNSLFTDPREAERLAQMWADLSDQLSDRPNDWVAYELMNEAIADDHEDWNRVLLYPYRAIREREPKRTIAIGSNRWCQAQTFPALRVPENDPNLMLVLHFYNPMLITHWKAPWSKDIRDYRGPVTYPGVPISENDWNALEPDLQRRLQDENIWWDRDRMEAFIQPAIAKARECGLPLWCNEFGVVKWMDDDIKRAWYRDFVSIMEENDIAWSNWDYRGQFGLYDGLTREPTMVIEALLGEPSLA